MAETICPPFGTGSLDFNKLHAAAEKGKPLEKAIEQATTGGPPLSDEPDEPVTHPSAPADVPVSGAA